MQDKASWKAGVNTHENMIFSCSGGMSNTGITTFLAGVEAVKELGLQKVGMGCLGGAPLKLPSVMGKAAAAKKIVTVDGCQFECSRKLAEAAGIPVYKSIVLTRDVQMKKKSLSEDIGGDMKSVMDYIDAGEVQAAKRLIVDAIEG